MATILSDGTHKAKKRHVCDECLNDIDVGEVYHKQSNIFEGDFCVWKSHIKCRELSTYLNRDSNSDEWHPLHDIPACVIQEAETKLNRENKPHDQ